MSTPPPRPKNAAPLLTPKQMLAIQALAKHNEFVYGSAAQMKMKAPLAKKELSDLAKKDSKDQKLANMVKLADGLYANSPKLQSACMTFGSKYVKNVAAGKMSYVAFKAEAKKIENLSGGLLAYAEKYHENFKALDDGYQRKSTMIKLVAGFCETFGKQVAELYKLIDKL